MTNSSASSRSPAKRTHRRPRGGRPLAAESVVDLADCADETFVLVSRTAAPISFDQGLAVCQSYGFTPQVIAEGTTPAARFGMVSAGVGVTIAPK